MSTIGEKEYYEMRYFTAACAAKTSKTPKMTLAEIYANAIQGCPPRSRSPLSSANVEKVVKPPQRPTFINRINRGQGSCFLRQELWWARWRSSPADWSQRFWPGKGSILWPEKARSHSAARRRENRRIQRQDNSKTSFFSFHQNSWWWCMLICSIFCR